MGYKASEWAYDLDLAPATKATLLALAHRADDKSGECYPGQKTVATMTGASVRTVNRALADLENLGVIGRQQRRRANGYKTSDLVVLNMSYRSQGHVTESHVTTSQVTESPTSHATLSDLTRHSVTYIEDEKSEEKPEEKSVLRSNDYSSDFDNFWTIYPRKQAKADALKAYVAARKKSTDAKTILDGAQAYALLNIGNDKSFLKLPAGWIRDERWNDELIEQRHEYDNRPMTRTAQNLTVVAQLAREETSAAHIITATTMCPIHPDYPDSLRFPCEACKRAAELPAGADF